MFINIIDKYISNFIDLFYIHRIKDNKIKNDSSVINVINNFLSNKIQTVFSKLDINKSSINNTITNITARYLIHYYYIHIFLNTKTDIDNNIDNIKKFFSNKFSKENKDYFNEETNSEIIKYITISLDILYKLKDNNHLFRNNESDKLWNFITSNLANKIKSSNIHNIIKIVLLKHHHLSQRETLFYSLTDKEKKKEFREIEIVVQKDHNIINQSVIENLFKIDNYDNTNRLFEFINKNLKLEVKKENLKKNIQELAYSKYIYFVVDDFLRFHKDNYRYDSEFLDQNADKKSKRRINIAVNKTNKVSKLYNNLNAKDKEEILIIMSNKLRKAMPINDIDEVKIIKRIYDEGKSKIDNEYYEDLMKIRQIPYNNFSSFKHSGIRTQFNKSIKLIRYCSFEQSKALSSSSEIGGYVQMRNSGKNIDTDIIGFVIPSNKPTRLKINNMQIHTSIDFNKIKQILFDSIKNQLSKSHCFIFKDNLNNEFIINLFNNIYLSITNSIYSKIFNKLDSKKYSEIYDYLQILDIYSNKYININYTNNLYNNFINLIYEKKYIKKNYKFDPNQKQQIKFNPRKIKQKFKNLHKPDNTVCQHILDWNILKKMDKHLELYSKLEFEFVKKYVQNIYDGDQIKFIVCKSCNQVLNLWNYVADGSYDENNNFITFYSSRYISLSEIDEYKKYSYIIEFLNKQYDKISELFNLSYHGQKKNKLRDNLIRESIYLIKYNFYDIKLQLNDKQKFIQYIKQFNLTSSSLYPMDIDLIDITTFTKKDDDKDTNDKIYINNLYSYIIVILIFNITNIDILFMKTHTKFNIESYIKVKDKLFDKCEIIVDNNTNRTEPILNYNILCYLIFILTSYVFSNNLWYSSSGKRSMQTHIAIIHTVIDIINRFIKIKSNYITLLNNHFSIKETSFKINLSKITQIFNIRFFQNLKELFNSKKTYKQIYINYKKEQIDREISESLGEVGSKYNIETIQKKSTNFYNIKPIFFNFYTKKYKKTRTTYKIQPWKINNLYIDRIYYDIKNKLCLMNNLDFCKKDNYEKHNRLTIFKFWKKYQNDLNIKKINQLNLFTKETTNKKEYIRNIFDNFEKININDHIKGFAKSLKYEIYDKYNININISDDQYSMNFYYNLKSRKTNLFINKQDIVETENIFKNNSDKTILKYNSKKEKIYYFFNKKNLGFIGYKMYNKELVTININIYRYFIVPENSLITKLKYLGLYYDTKVSDSIITSNKLHTIINSQFSYIKKYIRHILKYIYIIKNDKTLLTNTNHEYSFLSKYIRDYNIKDVVLQQKNIEVFKNWNFIYKFDINKVQNLQEYISKYNYIVYYFIQELFKLLEMNKKLQSEISFFIYEMINKFIKDDSNINSDFQQKIATYFIEVEQKNSDRFFKNIIGDDQFESLVDSQALVDKEPVIQEDGYDMMDNDNDEDDMMESEMS